MTFPVCFDIIRAICRTGSAVSALHYVLRPYDTAPLFLGPNKEWLFSTTSRVEKTEDVTFPTWCRKTNVTNEGIDLPQSCG